LPQQLRTKYGIVKDTTYSIDESIDIIFSTVDDLVEIGELSGHPVYPSQIVDLGFIIISKHHIFRINVRKWMQRPIVKQTWANFKDDFIADHQELRETDKSRQTGIP